MRTLPAAALLLASLPSLAQATHRAPQPLSDRPATSLPVTHVSLYKNGVGFFEHTGRVVGDAEVRIDFTTAQLNDVLQSLTAIDLNGGRIAGAGYNSTTPLDQQLKSLPLALSADTTAADFYAAIRGARVELRAPGIAITGRLLSVEDRPAASKSADDATPVADRHFITVVSDTGEVRTVELTAAVSVRLLDTTLHADVARYLQLLASNHSSGLRHLTLTDRAPNAARTPRELRVSYISEVPVWKSTYRILLTTPAAASTATLQGWSVVDNTTGEDWLNVQLSLIAGSPQSFIQPLSEPIYTRRPEIPIAQEAQLTPQTFDSSIDGIMALKVASPVAIAGEMKGMAGGMAYGVGPGSGGNTGGGMMRIGAAPPAPPAIVYEDAASASVSSRATTAAFDDYFAYNLTDPVTIRKNESALVPILQTKLPVESVTLVSSDGASASQPLRALWLTNASGLTLDRGSFTVIENGSFAGEGLLDPIHSDEKRLLSYAADQAVHVSVEANKFANHVTLIRGSRGVVNIHHADIHEIQFLIHNAAATHRTVVIELPVAGGYKLDPDVHPAETTATVYRFRVEVDASATVPLHISGSRSSYTTYYLTRSNDEQLSLLLKETGNNPRFEAALQPVLEARRKVADAQAAVDAANARISTLRADEERQRSNITALANADKGSRDRFVRDLNATEDAIAAANKELDTRTDALHAAQAALAAQIENFSINEKLATPSPKPAD